MSYGIQSKKLKKLINFYSPFNHGQQLKFLTLFKGEEGLLRYLQTSPFQGIDQTSLQERQHWFGSNKPIQYKSRSSLPRILVSPFDYFGMKLHLIFSILALVLGFVSQYDLLVFPWLGGIFNIVIFILVYILLIVPELYQHFQNIKLTEFAFQGCKVKIWRDNQPKQIHNFQLVVGDIVELQKGDLVGADGLIIEGQLSVKQYMGYKQLTTEKQTTKQCLRRWAQNQQVNHNFCLDVIQQQLLPSPIVLGGSRVLNGEARMVVLCVGKYSKIGNFVYEIHRAATQRKSEMEKKINAIIFEVSKYLVLSLIFLVLLYIVKIVVVMILERSIANANWPKIWIDFGRGLTVILMGMPISQVLGLAMGFSYIKFQVYRADKIWYKYAKDCANMKQVSSIIFEKADDNVPVVLKKWWNGQQNQIQNAKHNKYNNTFQQMFIKSCKTQDFTPYEVGLKLSSFFIGMNARSIEYLQDALYKFAIQRESAAKKSTKNIIVNSDVAIEQSQLSIQNVSQKQIQIIYLKGNSETLLKECTHMMDRNGKVVLLSEQIRENIHEIIWKMNAAQQPSLITGYIQVHPNHPKFREPDYKVVMLSLIGYKQNHDNQQFQSLARMKKLGISITLMGNRSHQQTIEMAKQMGIIISGKPSIRLRGYDFNKIVGGIICKFCKKSMCVCSPQQKYTPSLKNQDEFNRIYKHLNVLSQANSIQKLTLAVGFASVSEVTCFFGTSINDVPAMRVSSLSAAVQSNMHDQFVAAATQVILPDNKLITLQKMMLWSNCFHLFCKKYIVFALTPCLVAFASSCISFILYNNFCIHLFQFVWVSAVVCPLLGLTFLLKDPPSLDALQDMKRKDGQLLDKISHRQISSQVVAQILLIMIVLALGPKFIPEDPDDIDAIIGDNWSAKYNSQSRSTICSGVYNNIFQYGSQMYSDVFNNYSIHSRHLTIIFNLFVLMQIFNYFNCRNLGEQSHNFVDGINLKSCFSLLFSIGIHILVICMGKSIFGLYPYGLTLKQWAICLGLSLVVILVGLIVKQIPYDNQNQQNKVKAWPNRCCNLAVMATVPRQTLQDFQIDEQLQIRKGGNNQWKDS